MNTFEGKLVANGSKYAILVARFNSFIVESLLEGALDSLNRHGADQKDIDIIRVPGAFEMPVAAQKIAAIKKYDAIIALGAVIRGDTPHFEFVAGECVKGLSQVSLNANIPISFGVLTVDSIEQAIERAGTKAGNKGGEAAITALEMVNLFANLDQYGLDKQ